jgi:Ni/Co efflux regulator RcnB
LKKILVILLALVSSTATYAETVTDKNEKTKSEKEKKEYSSEELKESSAEPAFEKPEQEGIADKTQQEAKNDPDSSYYSVNKFNYLFYYVYKLKYLSEDDPELIMGVEP